MRNARSVLLVVMVAVIAGLAPASAGAKTESGAAILKACTQNNYKLPGHYNVDALKAAYNLISPASREYTVCAQVINDKINAELKNTHVTSSGSGGRGGGFPVVIVVIIVIVILGGGGAFYSYRRSRS